MADILAIIGTDTTLKKVAGTRGGEWAGPCSFCGGDDRFRVHPNWQGGEWHCRGCSPDERWHSVYDYVMKRDGLTFVEAKEAIDGPGSTKTKAPEDPQQYPTNHGCTWADYAKWQAALVPWIDYRKGQPTTGQTFDAIFFNDSAGGKFRVFNHPDPKIKFIPAATGQSAVLYGIAEAVQLANQTGQHELYLVNGQPSVIACHTHGIPAFTIPGGEGNIAGALRKGLLNQLLAHWAGPIRVAFDGDKQGYKSAPGVVDELADAGYIDVVALDLGQGNDAADLCRMNNGTSVQAFQGLPRLYPLPPSSTPPQQSGDDAERDFILACLDQEEAGDAQLLAHLFKHKLIFDFAAAEWYEFSTHVWVKFDTQPRRLVWSAVAAKYLSLAADLQNETANASTTTKGKLTSQADELIARARKLRHLNRASNVLVLAQELLGISGSEWDADPWLLGVKNGVLDLRTGQLRDGQPEDYLRTVAPTQWEGLDRAAPRWERFVSEVMSDESDRVAFLQRLLGYALNGSTKEHVVGVFVGARGRNGKRVLFESLQQVLGSYAQSVSTDILIGQEHKRIAGSAQPHLMELQGKRLAYCSETGEHDRLSTAQVKNISGGDPITARWLNQNPVTFLPTHTLFLQTNRKPQAPADDDALWERVKVIEFKTRFVDDPSAPDERPRDLALEETLQREAPGILAWLVRGGLLWQQGGLQTPPSVRLARDTYRREESIEPFLEAACVEADGLQAEGGGLYAAYDNWCKAQHLRAKSPVWFGKMLLQRFEKGRTATGRTCYYGLGLETTDFPEIMETTLQDSEGLGQNTQNPSEAYRKPNTTTSDVPFTRFPEGLGSILNRMDHDGTREGKNMNNPSDPSDPSGNTTPHSSVSVKPWADGPDQVPVSNSRIQELLDQGLSKAEAQRQAIEEARQTLKATAAS